MAGEPNISNISGRVYSLIEACDLMRSLDESFTKYNIRWKDVQTGEPVYIGYINAPKIRDYDSNSTI